MHVLVTCKYKKEQIKSNGEKVETSFSPLQVNRGFLLSWKPEFWSNLPQNLMQPFPHPSDATYKTTDGGLLVYYKLTLWAFGSGKLKKKCLHAYHIDNKDVIIRTELLLLWVLLMCKL